MNRLFIALAVLAAFVSPASARHHRAVAELNFFSIFETHEEPTHAHATRIHVRHARHVRHRGSRNLELVRSDRRGNMDGGNIKPDTFDVVETARSQIGNGAIYGRRSLWCARFMNWVLEKTGHHGTGSDMARSFASLPHTDLHVGAIAVMSRRGGGHVGVVSGITPEGNPVVISGNHAGRVRESVYPRRRIVTFVEVR